MRKQDYNQEAQIYTPAGAKESTAAVVLQVLGDKRSEKEAVRKTS